MVEIEVEKEKEDLGKRWGARRDAIAGEAWRLSSWEPLSAATALLLN